MESVLADSEMRVRRRPTQQRAVGTFDLILDTAGVLLERHGLDGFTTNLLAAQAGVSVRAVYRYFPNKHAVVVELAQRMAAQWRGALADTGSFDEPSTPWRELWCGYLDTFVAAVRATPGARAVLAAMRGDPELRRVDDEANQGYIDGLEITLRARSRNLSAAAARAVATVLIRSTVAVLDEAFEANEAVARGLIDVLKTMHVNLLAVYLERSTNRVRHQRLATGTRRVGR